LCILCVFILFQTCAPEINNSPTLITPTTTVDVHSLCAGVDGIYFALKDRQQCHHKRHGALVTSYPKINPQKQCVRTLFEERKKAAQAEVQKLLDARVIREVQFP